MRRVRELIVVEGRYDKNAVMQAVDATVLETSGFGVFNDAEKLLLIKKIASKRGVILLTDGDGAGFFIRGRLRGMLGGIGVKHAYIPDIKGRERRKAKASRAGMLGVEGMSREVIITALERAGATFDESDALPESGQPVTKADFFAAGLSGTADSSERRAELKRRLGLPERLSANGLLEVLNALYTREEFFGML